MWAIKMRSLMSIKAFFPFRWNIFDTEQNARLKCTIWSAPVWSAGEGSGTPHSSALAWKLPWTEGPGGLPSVGLHRVGHDWSDLVAAAAAAVWPATRAKTMSEVGTVVCCCLVVNCVWLFVTPWTVACQVPLFIGFPGQKHGSGLPFLRIRYKFWQMQTSM